MRITPPAASHVITPSAPGVDTRPLDVQSRGSLAMHPKDTGKYATPFLASASSIVGIGGTAWVAGDRYRALIRYDDLAKEGELDADLHKRDGRYDLEAIAAAHSAKAKEGVSTIIAFGSGSAPDRDRAIAQDVDATGHATGKSQHVTLTNLYAALGAKLGARLNIEGATFRTAADGLELLLFQRDESADNMSTIFRLDGQAVLDAARDGKSIKASALRGVSTVRLGQIDGVNLGFSDAKALPDGRIAFTASGEVKHEDGTRDITGSAFGVLDADLEVTTLRPFSGPARKVEGLELASTLNPASPANRFVAVCDADDPLKPSKLLEFDA